MVVSPGGHVSLVLVEEYMRLVSTGQLLGLPRVCPHVVSQFFAVNKHTPSGKPGAKDPQGPIINIGQENYTWSVLVSLFTPVLGLLC